MKILDLSMFALPGACALSALIVWCLHWAGCSAQAYWWYALPLAATLLYLAYFRALVRQSHRGQ